MPLRLFAQSEPLEKRTLLSSVDAAGVLHVDGTAGGDAISIFSADAGASIAVSIDGTGETFDARTVHSIIVHALAGNDEVAIDQALTVPASIFGDEGDDSLVGGGGDDTLVGGAGNDTLSGGNGSDGSDVNTADYSAVSSDMVVNGTSVSFGDETDQLGLNIQRLLTGSGNDQISVTSFSSTNGIKFVDAGAGNDNINFLALSGTDPTVHGGAGDDTIYIGAAGHTGYYFGDAGNDTFTVERSDGTAHDFNGGDGTDTVDYSRYSNEFWPVTVTLDGVANDGSPTAQAAGGPPGWDNVRTDVEKVIGTPGPDTMVGSNANETFLGGGGNDSLDGGGGDDSLDGGADDDTLIGGPGHDTLIGGPGVDSLVSDADDTVTDGAGATITGDKLDVSGTEVTDTITLALNKNDSGKIDITINGETSTFSLSGLQACRISADGGDDTITVDPNLSLNMDVFGGDGNDTISLGGNAFAHVEGGAGDDRITITGGNSYKVLLGQDGNDTILGGDGGELLDGGAGNDSLSGGGGVDTLLGGDGDDTLDGGAGADSLDGGAGTNTLADLEPAATLPGNGSFLVSANILRIKGTDQGDNIVVSINTKHSYLLNITINGVTGHASLKHLKTIYVYGDAGNDTIDMKSITLGSRIYGGDGDDVVYGTGGRDRISGGNGNDWINAEGGNDTIYGDDGNDRLFGASGKDYLNGGAGSNLLRGGDSVDRIVALKSLDNYKGNPGDIFTIIESL